MRGSGATVWLLGSVHLLRESDYPLPENVDRVMARAERLVLELDLDAVDPITSQMIVFSLGRLEEGQSLADVMGNRSYRLAAKRAEKLGIDLGMLSALKPWFAALTIMNIEMLRLGFNPELGLEQYLANQARQSGKEIVGLETMEYQLGLFDELSYDTQSALLLQTLSEAARHWPLLSRAASRTTRRFIEASSQIAMRPGSARSWISAAAVMTVWWS
jgi:uncharacterized protein YbaP (TraB family)